MDYSEAISSVARALSSGITTGLLAHEGSQRLWWGREFHDRLDKPSDPTLYFTELGVKRLAAKGAEPPEPLRLSLTLEWRPLWRRERRWTAFVAPGTISALKAGIVGIELESAPPPRTVVVLEEWRVWGPKPPKPPRGGLLSPLSVPFWTRPNAAFG